MTWDRRQVWRLLAPAAAMLCLGAFSPRGLDTWRQHSLFVLFRDGDHADREAATLVTTRLAEKLPDSRAQPLPVSELRLIGELLLSQQYDVALLGTADAEAIDRWAAASAGAQSEPLVLLARVRAHLLICRVDFPAGQAAMVAAALADLSPQDAAAPAPPLAWHSAVRR
jgi:hypothetical protein